MLKIILNKNNSFFIILLFFLNFLYFSMIEVKAQNNRQETYKQLNLFGDVFQRVQEQYVEEITDKELRICYFRYASIVRSTFLIFQS